MKPFLTALLALPCFAFGAEKADKYQVTGPIIEVTDTKIVVEGRGKEHEWQSAEEALKEHDHPLWKEIAETAKGAGHGGMDFIEDYRLIKCLRDGSPTDMNVYDAAALSSLVPLTAKSVGRKAASVDIPDFTRGRWKTTPPLAIVGM